MIVGKTREKTGRQRKMGWGGEGGGGGGGEREKYSRSEKRQGRGIIGKRSFASRNFFTRHDWEQVRAAEQGLINLKSFTGSLNVCVTNTKCIIISNQ